MQKRIVIIDHGTVFASATLAELCRLLPTTAALVIECEGAFDASTLLPLPGVGSTRRAGDQVTVATNGLASVSPVVLQTLTAAGCRVRALSSGRASLEDQRCAMAILEFISNKIARFMQCIVRARLPSFVFPEWMQRVAQFAPTRWAVDGLDAMTWRGQGLAAAYAPVGLMLGAAMLFGGIAIRWFDWEE